MKPAIRSRFLLPPSLLLLGLATATMATKPERKYHQAPDAIREILDVPAPFRMIVSPDGGTLMLARPLYYPPIADLSGEMLALAGVRINPKNNGPHRPSYYVELKLKDLPDGAERPVKLPRRAKINTTVWNAGGTLVALTNVTDTAIELWVLDTKKGKARRVRGLQVNQVLGAGVQWMPDQKTLLVKTVPRKRPAPPPKPRTPPGPYIEESKTVAAASSTYEERDLLKTPHDADLFEHYATSRLALVDTRTLRVKRIGPSAVYDGVAPSPDGRYLFVERVKRPYSFLRPYWRFPCEVEIRDRRGRTVEKIADLPVAEEVPIRGVRMGPRYFEWCPTEPATLVWIEALDGGDSFKKVDHHDRIMSKAVGKKAVELHRLEQRYAGIYWLEGGSLALFWDVNLDTHRLRTYLVARGDEKKPPRLVWERNYMDRYGDPGRPIYRVAENGVRLVRVHDGAIFLRGWGASPQGDRPFLDRLDLGSLKSERLFRSATDSLEHYLGGIDPAAGTFFTVKESPTYPPNVHLRELGSPVEGEVATGEARRTSTSRALTRFGDPVPKVREISKRLVKYEREDGIPLSFTLYLPPGYKEGTRLPTVFWAYPLDYTETKAAGQVMAWPQEFTTLRGTTPVFLTLQGYAVLDIVSMPVVGPSETAYDTFIEQIRMNARAAIDKAVALGVTDPDRVGVMGHSHGGLMTANLLAWTDKFRAGIARSGAYNHTMRPFGFQNERRTLYKARETYLKLSPLINADKIDEPLLLIHGEIDANPGTVTLQSRKLYDALRGLGAHARLVILPYESHGYTARESTEHVLWEMVDWFDRHVKNAKPREPKK